MNHGHPDPPYILEFAFTLYNFVGMLFVLSSIGTSVSGSILWGSFLQYCTKTVQKKLLLASSNVQKSTIISAPLKASVNMALLAHHKQKYHFISANTIKGGCHIKPKMPKKHWASISGKNLSFITIN